MTKFGRGATVPDFLVQDSANAKPSRFRDTEKVHVSAFPQSNRPLNLSLSQFFKDGCIGERQMALVCKKHKRPEGQQVAHILTLNMY